MDLVIPSPASLALFIGAALALLLIPGPAVLYLVGRSIEHGRRAGLISVLGIQAATLVHVAAAALGLSALLASSALAFGLVKMAGAAYLIWLGLQKLLGCRRVTSSGDTPREAPRLARLMRDGFVVNLLNPKTAIFFLAFLPQFVDVSRGQVATQIAVLGGLLAALGLMTDSAYALAAGSVGTVLKHSRVYASVERYVSGLLLIGLGLTAALASDNRK
jgi:threonine/homoserine/homoserine lactone efflux protein